MKNKIELKAWVKMDKWKKMDTYNWNIDKIRKQDEIERNWTKMKK